MCVCVREREREGERETDRQTESPATTRWPEMSKQTVPFDPGFVPFPQLQFSASFVLRGREETSCVEKCGIQASVCVCQLRSLIPRFLFYGPALRYACVGRGDRLTER